MSEAASGSSGTSPLWLRLVPAALFLLVALCLGSCDVIADRGDLQILHLGLLAACGLGAAGILLWEARRVPEPVRWLALGLVLLALAVSSSLVLGKSMRYFGPLSPEVLLQLDADGTAFSRDYPQHPKALMGLGSQPGAHELYFRPLYFGVLLGPRRTPYQG